MNISKWNGTHWQLAVSDTWVNQLNINEFEVALVSL